MINTDSITVDVSPEMEMYRVLQNSAYDTWRALAEFLDNSTQSYLDNKDSLNAIEGNHYTPKIIIRAFSNDYPHHKKRNSIIIEDNVAGIKKEDFQRAIRPGSRNNDRKTGSIGEYGIGMKSAAVWFSNHWKIKTTALGFSKELSLDFNLNSLIKNNKSKIKAAIKTVPLTAHYTKISLLNVRHSIVLEPEKVFRELQEIFLLFNEKITIQLFVDDKIIPDTPAILRHHKILKAPKFNSERKPEGQDKSWKKDILFHTQKKKIEGYIYIREKGSYKNNPGIRLFKNKRLIEGTCSNPNIPLDIFGTKNKYGPQRIYGELHLNNFDLDFSKSKFIDPLMSEMYEDLKMLLTTPDLNLIEQASNYRTNYGKKGKSESALQTMIKELSDVVDNDKLKSLLNEMQALIKIKNSPKNCPTLIASGLRSILEKSLYVSCQNKNFDLGRSHISPPSLSQMLKK